MSSASANVAKPTTIAVRRKRTSAKVAARGRRRMARDEGIMGPPRYCNGMENVLDLTAALAYSRYATMALAAEPSEGELLRATVDSPFDWPRAREALAAD